MKKILTSCFAFIAIASLTVRAQTEAEMKAWMDYMTPGEAHKILEKSNGTWNGQITMWMAPGAPATNSTGQMVNSMVLGGRYQVGNHTGSFNGMPFEGISTVAFDNAKKVFISTWIDNMGTGLMVLEGPWDKSTNTIRLKGKMVDPISGKDVEVRETLKMIDDNNQVMEMFCSGPDGKEYKNMEIKYTRVK